MSVYKHPKYIFINKSELIKGTLNVVVFFSMQFCINETRQIFQNALLFSTGGFWVEKNREIIS